MGEETSWWYFCCHRDNDDGSVPAKFTHTFHVIGVEMPKQIAKYLSDAWLQCFVRVPIKFKELCHLPDLNDTICKRVFRLGV